MTLIDLEYDDFVTKALQMPPEVLQDIAEALEDRVRGLEAAVAASRVKGDKGAEVRLLMALAWNARKLAALKAIMAEARWKGERGQEGQGQGGDLDG